MGRKVTGKISDRMNMISGSHFISLFLRGAIDLQKVSKQNHKEDKEKTPHPWWKHEFQYVYLIALLPNVTPFASIDIVICICDLKMFTLIVME